MWYLWLFSDFPRRDLLRSHTVMEMVKKREQMKHEKLYLSMAIFEKRVQLRDFNGAIVSELGGSLPNNR